MDFAFLLVSKTNEKGSGTGLSYEGEASFERAPLGYDDVEPQEEAVQCIAQLRRTDFLERDPQHSAHI